MHSEATVRTPKLAKRRARRNAVRLVLTAETAVTAVERELVLRFASLLWRMRRASPIETDLFQIQAEILSDRQYEYETGIGPRITERVINRFDEQRLWRSMRSNLREIAYRIDPALWVHHILGVARGFFKGTARRVHSGDRASA